jgi:GDP-L-fucose synthase
MPELTENARIFVAGHRGLVGAAILRRLQREGFTNLLTATRQQLDLRDQAAVNYWFRANRPEYVFLVAGTVGGIWANATRPAEFIYDNMMIHATVVHAAHIFQTEKLLYLGSSCIYPRECPQPMVEEYLLTGLLEPTNEPYAIAKIAGIKLCQAYRKQYGSNFISAMPTNLYGPHDNFDLLSSHVLPALIRKFHLAKLAARGDLEGLDQDEALFGPIPPELKGALGIPRVKSKIRNPKSEIPTDPPHASRLTPSRSVVIWGSGSPRREFLYVDDLADACLYLMNHYSEDPHINIGAGEDCTIRELAEMVREAVYPEAALVFDAGKPDGTPQKLLDVHRLQQMGWKGRTNLREGISSTYAWYLNQGKGKQAP